MSAEQTVRAFLTAIGGHEPARAVSFLRISTYDGPTARRLLSLLEEYASAEPFRTLEDGG